MVGDIKVSVLDKEHASQVSSLKYVQTINNNFSRILVPSNGIQTIVNELRHS